MAKRSISKIFYKDTEVAEVYDWLNTNLPTEVRENGEWDCVDRKISITINFDPGGSMSMIPEGPKIPKHHAKTRG